MSKLTIEIRKIESGLYAWFANEPDTEVFYSSMAGSKTFETEESCFEDLLAFIKCKLHSTPSLKALESELFAVKAAATVLARSVVEMQAQRSEHDIAVHGVAVKVTAERWSDRTKAIALTARHRDQVADLILKNQEGEELVISSNLTQVSDHTVSFEVMRPIENVRDRREVERYLISIHTEEL